MRFLSVAALTLAGLSQVFAQNAIDQSTFDNIIQYTRFARAAYASNCATPPNSSVVLNYFSDATTQAYGTLFRYDGNKQIVLSFRGTATPGNWYSDLNFGLTNVTIIGTNCPSCRIHTGFQSLYNALAQQVLTATRAAVAANPGYSLVLVGHSLGGALASLGSVALSVNGLKVSSVYTYGEPRNGNNQWSAYVTSFVSNANYFRVTHANDAVPSLPPSFLGYLHHGTEYWEQATGYNNTVSTTVACPPVLGFENLSCNLAQNSKTPINHAHVTYSNQVTGNSLHIYDCGAPYP